MFFPALVLYLIYGATYFAARSTWKSSQAVRGQVQYSSAHDRIGQVMATGRAELKWNAFPRVKETNDMFLLFVKEPRISYSKTCVSHVGTN